jgi:hypothetical protein
VYRGAPVVAVIPARDPAPRGLGLRVTVDRDVLDIRIGGRGLLGRRHLAAVAVLLNAVWSGAILLAAALDASEGALYAVFAGVFAVLAVATRPMRRENERLIVANGRLVWRRMRGQDEVLASDAIALDRVRSVHDRGDGIAVEIDGGRVWHLGSGLGVPDDVRGWVARRLALLLPLPARP